MSNTFYVNKQSGKSKRQFASHPQIFGLAVASASTIPGALPINGQA
jgi:hypothetical protein